jgi:surface antigen
VITPGNESALHSAILEALETGDPQRWKDNEQKLHGYVTVSSELQYPNGKLCRNFYFTVDNTDPRSVSTSSIACKDDGKDWIFDQTISASAN